MFKQRHGPYAFCSLAILIVYCISLAPSFISHEHDNLHNHNQNELSYCENITENLNQHIHCSHKHHFSNLKNDCFLCDYFAINDYLGLIHMIEPNNRLVAKKDYGLCKKLNLQEFINYLNKSPPILV